MASPAYRKANQHTGLWIGICIVGALLQIALISLLTAFDLVDRLGLWVFPIAVTPIALALFLGWRMMTRKRSQRVSQLAQALSPLGFSVVSDATDAQKSDFAAPLIHLFPTLELLTGTSAIQWIATEGDDANGALLFEHEYITGSGSYAVVHQHTVLALRTGDRRIADHTLATAPWFVMARFPFLRRRAAKNTIAVPEFTDPGNQWSMFGNAETGTRFLTARVQSLLHKAPVGEVWCLGAGYVCCAFGGTLDAPQIRAFLTHAQRVIGSDAGL